MIAFGPGVLQIQYLLLLLEPLMLYTGGLDCLADRMARRLPLDLQHRLARHCAGQCRLGRRLGSAGKAATFATRARRTCDDGAGWSVHDRQIHQHVDRRAMAGQRRLLARGDRLVDARSSRAASATTQRLRPIRVCHRLERARPFAAARRRAEAAFGLALAAIAVSLHDRRPAQSQSLRNPRPTGPIRPW